MKQLEFPDIGRPRVVRIPGHDEEQRQVTIAGAREVLAVLDVTPDWRGVVRVRVEERKSA